MNLLTAIYFFCAWVVLYWTGCAIVGTVQGIIRFMRTKGAK